MYGKLKQLSIEELEVEIEDLDICISRLKVENNDIARQIKDLQEIQTANINKITGMRVLSDMISELILEKQREEAQ